MAYMTDEEADALDEELTRVIPELGPNGEGFFSGKAVNAEAQAPLRGAALQLNSEE